MAKPTKPDISIPTSFADTGQKTDFTEEKLQNGFDSINPDVLTGDNLNKFIDDTYKGLNYSIDSIEYLYNLNNKDLINQSKALKTGNVSSDSDVYADVLSYAHSTFDLSKFEIVGSPTITDDGVASGFSYGNYLITPKIDLSTANSWTIITPWFSFSDLQDRKNIITADYITTNGSNIYVILNDSKHIEMRVAYQNWSSFLAPADITNIVVNKKYQTKIEFTGTRYNFYYRSEDNMNWTQTSDGGFMSNTKVALNNVLGVGADQNGNSVATNTSIDLKQFSITVDGKEVFSGNKTGMDVIKPDNYTVVGSPVISDDGVASGFSASNIITISDVPTFDKPFKVCFKVKWFK